MPVTKCQLESQYNDTTDVHASLLIVHKNVFTNAGYSKPKPPKMEHPRTGRSCSEEVGDTCLQKRTIFKDSKEMSEPKTSSIVYVLYKNTIFELKKLYLKTLSLLLFFQITAIQYFFIWSFLSLFQTKSEEHV